jgi:uncharacterized heparinase superfamily protein
MNRRFHHKLAEQLRFIRRSSDAFDRGEEEEALRIAVSLRTIFHDTTQSVSILRHIGMKDGNIQTDRQEGISCC